MAYLISWHFPKSLWLSWRSITLICRKQKSVSMQSIPSGCPEFSSQGHVPQPTVVVDPAEQHGDSIAAPFTLLLAGFLFPFSCTWTSVAPKTETCTPLGPVSQKCVASNVGVRFPWQLFCLVHAVQAASPSFQTEARSRP